MKKTAIVFGSTSGNTEKVAMLIAEKVGKEKTVVMNVTGFSVSDISGFDLLILGTSTWGFGDIQGDWEQVIPLLKKSDLSGKTVALFGLGDSSSYSETFVDGMGVLYEELKQTGAVFTGFCDTAGYDFSSSRAVVNGKFVGLPIDEDNESEKTTGRIEAWVNTIRQSLEERA